MRRNLVLGLCGVIGLTWAAGCNNQAEGPGKPRAAASKANTPKPAAVPGAGAGNKADTPSSAPAPAEAPPPAAAAPGGFGTVIKGQVVFAGDKLPERAKIDVTKDQGHCLANGPLLDEKWVVNPANKGVRWVAVFLKPAAGQPLPVHDTLKASAAKEVVLDEPTCTFAPHVLAMRDDQKLVALNKAPVAHNVIIKGFANDFNRTIASNGGKDSFNLAAEKFPISVSCGIHPWMKASLWVFDHPYYAVTDADGKFEIRLPPSGPQTLMVWHEETGFVGGKNGKTVQIVADKITDVGTIPLKAE